MWTVIGNKPEILGDNQELAHTFMILSQKESTMVILLFMFISNAFNFEIFLFLSASTMKL